MAKKITKAQEKKYIAKKGTICPFCGSKNVTAGHPELGDHGVDVPVDCAQCDKSWTDSYTLTGIVEAEETPSKKNAVALKVENLWVAMHTHRHGVDITPFFFTPTKRGEQPDQDSVVKQLEIDLEEDRDDEFFEITNVSAEEIKTVTND